MTELFRVENLHAKPAEGDDISEWPTYARAKAGIFSCFQYPQEIAGVSVIQFLSQALSARKGFDLSVVEIRLCVMNWMKRLGMDPSLLERSGYDVYRSALV